MAGTTPERFRGLVGEDLGTTHWEDARPWISIYADLLRFKTGLLERIRSDLTKLRPVAREAAATDLAIIESQMRDYKGRLDLWSQRLWELRGLELDPQGPVIRHRDREGRLTKREFQLLQFLLDHPHRYYSATHLLSGAWSEPGLYPEEVRNYVRRLRKILADLGIPAQLVNRPYRGYALEFRADD